MKKNLVEIVFILDKSGSMFGLENDTIGGFNSMIENQKNEGYEAFVSTVLFNDNYKMLHDHVDINKVKPMTHMDYYVGGSTALYDAVGRTINSVGERLFNTAEEERPEKVIFVITTDGYENASREFSKAKVREMIEHQQDKYSWTFMFLGANIDAEKEATSLGIDEDFAITYFADAIGVSDSYDAISASVNYIAACDSSISACKSELKAILNDKINSSAKTYSDADYDTQTLTYVQSCCDATANYSMPISAIDVAISSAKDSAISVTSDSLECIDEKLIGRVFA